MNWIKRIFSPSNHLETFFSDIRFGLRILRRSPGFTCVAVLTLALGIGASTAVFSIVDAVLLRPLPYKDANRLVVVWVTENGQPGARFFAPFSDFQESQANSRSFEEVAALTWARAGEILNWQGSPHQVLAIPATANIFSLLGVSAAQGRTFTPQDLHNGCTVVLSHLFWQTELSSAPDIVGGTLNLSGKPCTVAGIMPRGFDFYPKETSLWTLITPDSPYFKKPFDSGVSIFARLRPGISMESAQAELESLHQKSAKGSPAGNWVGHIAPVVLDMREQFTWMAGRNLRTALLVLSASVLLLLFIACLNVVNLLLGRSSERYRELAVRAALGSGRMRLVRQLFTESMLLAVLGTLFGVLLAVAGVRYFNSSNFVDLPPGNQVIVNFRVMGFAVLLTTFSGLLFGLMPAWRASRVDLNEVLKQSGRSVVHGGGRRTSRLLVVGQVALSMILLAGATLLIESMLRLGSVPLGFRSDHLLTAEVALPPSDYSKLSQRSSFYDKVLDGLGALPGVEGVALCSVLPPYGGTLSELAIEGKAPIESFQAVNRLEISGGYFRVMGIPLLQGREFDFRDREASQPVAIVSDSMARKYFPGEYAIGKQIKLGKAGDSAPWLTVVGVVGSEKRTSVFVEMGYVEPALVYLPVMQDSSTSMAVAMRVAGNASGLGVQLQRAVSRIDREVPIFNIKSMTERYSQFLAQPRFRAILMGILAGLTLLLAAIGIYGVLAQLVSQRTREVGIRMAFGAHPSEVLGMILREGGRMAGLGILIGVAGAFALTRLMSAMLYGVKASDPFVFAGVAIILTLVALSASYIPARRASRLDPMDALRDE